MSAPLVKPAKRGPAPRKRIQRTAPIARSSSPIPRRKRVNQMSQTRAAERRRQDDTLWRHAVRDEAGGFCERCGAPGTSAHHVYGRRTWSRLRFVLSNGVYLCTACHTGASDCAHRKPVQFREWFARHRPAAWRELMGRLGRPVETPHQTKETAR